MANRPSKLAGQWHQASIAEIIEQAISAAPALQDTYDYGRGTQEADRRYPGERSMRFAFNAGVKWVLDQMGAV